MTEGTVTKKKRVVRTADMPEFPYSQEDVKRVSALVNEPSWLNTRRLQAWDRYTSTPMPTTKDEPWRRTNLRSLPADAFDLEPVLDVPVDEGLLEPLVGDAHGSLLVIRPGHPPDRSEAKDSREKGIIFSDWGTALREHGEILKKYLGTVVKDDEGKFASLAASLAVDGALLYVPRGVRAEDPFHSILWTPGSGRASFSRILLILGEGASATYVHEMASPNEAEGESFHAGIVEVIVGRGASLQFVELQNFGEHVWNVTHERAHIEKDGRLDWVFGAVGSRLTKNFTDIDLRGEGSEGRISGFYFADGRQHLDHDTQQNHLAPHTTSDLLYKGALVGQSRSVWQGMIYVAPGAQKTDGYQANRNLILSRQARADSIPGLEILADDVRCTHGATVGQLEAEPIFYLMSRGLPRKDAERLVVDGFFSPIMERIPFEGVRSRFESMIDIKLGA
jgi:Fe-S cluster assembly protein SufD